MMSLWDNYKDFSADFLTRHHGYVLLNMLHRIKSFLLHPLNCNCKGDCACEEIREKIVLSLNIDHYNKAQKRQEVPEKLYAMKLLLNIPDDSYFKLHYAHSYPIWLIKEKFQEESTRKNFKIVERLIWGLLRLGKTYELSMLNEPRASINEAIALILGGMPLKTTAKKLEKEEYLCGEKGYSAQLNTYKPVCHFIAAFRFMEENSPSFSLAEPEQIQKFLSLSHWFRKKLLILQTPNVKEKSLFSEDTLLSLPSWVNSDDVHIIIDPLEDKLLKANAYFS